MHLRMMIDNLQMKPVGGKHISIAFNDLPSTLFETVFQSSGKNIMDVDLVGTIL